MARPLLDVSDLTLDIDLADSFDVIRRAVADTIHGRQIITPTTYPNVVGVVCMAGPNDLLRLPEEQHQGKIISIVTKFRLQGPSPGFQADIVDWQGSQFVVIQTDDYTDYGAGQVQALASSIIYVDPAQEPAPT